MLEQNLKVEVENFMIFRVLLIFAYYFKMIKADVLAYENTYINYYFASASCFRDFFVDVKKIMKNVFLYEKIYFS